MDISDALTKQSMYIDRGRIHIWESLLNTGVVLNNQSIVTIDGVKGEAYKGNFYGLLNNVLDVSPALWYITLRVNNLRTPIDYNGLINIIVLDPVIMSDILTLVENA